MERAASKADPEAGLSTRGHMAGRAVLLWSLASDAVQQRNGHALGPAYLGPSCRLKDPLLARLGSTAPPLGDLCGGNRAMYDSSDQIDGDCENVSLVVGPFARHPPQLAPKAKEHRASEWRA